LNSTVEENIHPEDAPGESRERGKKDKSRRNGTVPGAHERARGKPCLYFTKGWAGVEKGQLREKKRNREKKSPRAKMQHGPASIEPNAAERVMPKRRSP